MAQVWADLEQCRSPCHVMQDLRGSGKPDPIFWHMLKNFSPSVACSAVDAVFAS